MLTELEPNVSPTGRYPIGMAAKLLGIHRNTLRQYTEAGMIKCGFRRKGRPMRFYMGSELMRFWKSTL